MSLRDLSTYRKKRDFEKTAEPSGDRPVKPSKQRRFVIQKHAATRLHYDLRLELDGVFKSWAVTRGPRSIRTTSGSPSRSRTIRSTTATSKAPFPKGQYGGGTVQLWDRGYWEAEAIPEEGLRRATSNSRWTASSCTAAGCWCA